MFIKRSQNEINRSKIPMVQIIRANRDNFPSGSIKTYIVTPHLHYLIHTVLMRSHNELFSFRNKKKLSSNYPNYPLLSRAVDNY